LTGGVKEREDRISQSAWQSKGAHMKGRGISRLLAWIVGGIAGIAAGLLLPEPQGSNLPYYFDQAGEPCQVPAIAVGDIDRDSLDEWAYVVRSQDVDLYDHDGTWLRTWATVLVGRDQGSENEHRVILNAPLDFRGDGRREVSAPYSLDSGISVLKILDLSAARADSLFVARGKGANGLTYRSHIIPLWAGTIEKGGPPVVAVANQVERSLFDRGLGMLRAGSLDTLWNFEAPGGVGLPLCIGPFVSRTQNQIVFLSYGCWNGNITDQGRPDSVSWFFVLDDSGRCRQALAFPEFTHMIYLDVDANGDGYRDLLTYQSPVDVSESNPMYQRVWYGGPDSLKSGPMTVQRVMTDVLEKVPDGKDTLILAGYRNGAAKTMDARLKTVDSTLIADIRWGTQRIRVAPGSSSADVLVVVRDREQMRDHVHMLSPHLKLEAEVTPGMKQITVLYPWIEGTTQRHCGFMAFDAPNGELVRFRCLRAPFYSHYRRVIFASGGGLLGLLLVLAHFSALRLRKTIDLSLLVQRAGGPMLLLDERGVVVEFNPAMTPLLGSGKLALKQPLAPEHSPAGLARIAEEFLKSRAREQICRTDTPFPAEIRLDRLPDGHVVCSARDLRSEHALTLSVQWARILGMLAHRLKGRLQQLSSLTWRLRDHTDEVGMKTVRDLEAYIADITRQAARMSQLSAISECPLSPLPLVKLLKEKVPRIAAVCVPPVHAEIAVEGDPDVRVLGNELAMGEVLENIISNACRSGPEPVRVMVSVGAEELPEDANTTRHWIVIRFTDSGHGIPPEDLARLGLPLFTRREGGTGLGIAIVNQLMTMQKGRFEIDSQVGQGTCVTLWFQPTRES
jgi:signal transduction histidine kinase